MIRPRTALVAALLTATFGLAAPPLASAQASGTTAQTCDRSFSRPAPGTGAAWRAGGRDPNFRPDAGANTEATFGAGGDGSPTYGPEWYSGVPCTNPGTPTRTSPPGPLEDVTGVLGGLFG